MVEYSWRKLGYENIVVLSDTKTSFVDKYFEFLKLAEDSKEDSIIRTDGDCLAFEIDYFS